MRKILKNLLRCKRDRVLPKPAFMGDLPKERFWNLKLLESITLDYIIIKFQKKNRTAKGVQNCYGVLFIYPTTKTIHIELPGELSTNDFLLALWRFISSRGTVKSIRSYNGTNFAGAKNKIKTCLNQLD